MTPRAALLRIVMQEDVNFLITNRLPRRWLTLLAGRVSRLEHPWVRALGLALWRLFSDLDLSEARGTEFASLHAVFTRQLKEGARPIDPDPATVVSPCDGIVGALGQVEAGMVLQAKGFPYRLAELLSSEDGARAHAGGSYVTLRLTAGMYHRFHAPHDCRVDHVTYISGDTWNVNPIALARIERLFCKNERAVIRCRLDAGAVPVTLVAVAAILVASIRLHFLEGALNLRYRGPHELPCRAHLEKGEEMGYFEHGSTIIVLLPPGMQLANGLAPGQRIRMGEPLARLAPA
ncbi:MAG TPA: archaetidylserine decarboxylase [Steroidobacteraceae bacterium]|nr:archaetidylserine decarboxylase [Steroidobacteraceae bacterium]